MELVNFREKGTPKQISVSSENSEVVLRRSKLNSERGSSTGNRESSRSDGVTFGGEQSYDNSSFISEDQLETDSYNGDNDYYPPGSKRESEELKAWDRFKTLPPPDEDETLDGEWLQVFIKWFKIFAYFFTFFVTLGSAVVSKSLILLMTSMIKVNRTIPICNDKIFPISPPLEPDKKYAVKYLDNDPERIAWLWTLFFAVITPDLFTLGRSVRICYFKIYQIPTLKTFLTVFTTETLHVIGVSLLVFSVLPTIDAIKGAMMTNGLCLIPGIFLLMSNHDKNNTTNRMLTFAATFFQFIGLVVWPMSAENDNSTKYWYLPFALFLISFQWWENFLDPTTENKFLRSLLKVKKELTKTRYFTYVCISLWKMSLTFGLMILIEYINDGTRAVESTFQYFKTGFDNNKIMITRDKSDLEYQAPIEGEILEMTVTDPYIAVWFLLIQLSATYLCYAVGKFSCKICIQGISFAIPVNLAVPVTVSFMWAMVSASAENKCQLSQFFNGFQYIFWYTSQTDVFTYDSNAYNYVNTFMWILSLASQLWITIHIWFSTSERLASTETLFIIPMYNSVIVDQSLAMNRRRINILDDIPVDEETAETDKSEATEATDKGMGHLYESVNESMSPVPYHNESDETVRIFVCATMWHENKEEMIQMLKAVMRLDDDQCARRQAQQFFNLHPSLTDYYEIEINIFFDDAFDQGETDDEDDRIINRFVKQLIETMDEAASNVHETNIVLKRPNVVPTPYGGKLEWTLPGQNKLVAHLKDKILIRHRKRWSQCMYMYYLLGHRIAERPIDEKRKETIAMNTFILALDGDINFRPHALHLVVDLMKKNKKLGAACGRIHPIGSGPMVWYQKFEYAIGHWLQKATEHVFGCVLCSPGCFSLFRARAVMDDSVMNKYTTKPSEALHYVQYDQGEDRWLCTLLLQQGWRIEYCAASDSYTHAPEGFGEFYTQRRRWAPSTMANIMDLLGDYKRTVACNTDISKPYIIYQAMLMVGTVLSPGTIFLMVVGAMNTVMGLRSEVALACNIVPILAFCIVCMTVKKNDHIIFLAMILSTLYALLMLAVLVGTAIEIADPNKGWLTPNAIFFSLMMGSFIVAAIIHPQEFACVIPLPLYMLLIPSMYLLLTIYSVTNMHIVSWGTREVKSKLTAKEAAQAAQAAAEAAAAKAKKKNLLGFLDISQYGSKSGLFTCMCCSNSKSEEESAKLSEIREQLNKVNENVNTIKSNIVSESSSGRRNTIYRRQSSANKHDRNEILATIVGGQTDEEEDDNFSDNERKSNATEEAGLQLPKTIFDETNPRWIKDKTFKKFPIVPLSANELQFWKDFIPKYLLPLDENPKEQARIASDLKELRNRMVFAFGIMNTIFILFVFLLQMHKDVFGIYIPSGVDYNSTYNEKEDRYDRVPIYRTVEMDPIGLCLVVFFGIVLIVQIIGMFMHRFGTLAHLLAFTTIDFCSKKAEEEDDETILNRNAVKITKQLQKLKGLEEYEDKKVISTNNLPNNRKSIYPDAKPQQLDLDQAFRRRIMSLRPDSFDPTEKSLLRRQSTVKALRKRRDTMIREEKRLSSIESDNQSTIGSQNRPVSWMSGSRVAFEPRTTINNSLRGLQQNELRL